MKHLYLFLILGTVLFAQEQPPTDRQEPAIECHHLSKQEKEFASGLNHLHRVMFCRHFSVTQRKEAMNMVRTSEGKMSGDIAVEEVIKGTRAPSEYESQSTAQYRKRERSPSS